MIYTAVGNKQYEGSYSLISPRRMHSRECLKIDNVQCKEAFAWDLCRCQLERGDLGVQAHHKL